MHPGRSARDVTETLVGMHWNLAEGFTGSRLTYMRTQSRKLAGIAQGNNEAGGVYRCW